MNKILIFTPLALSISLLLTGCTPGPAEDTSDADTGMVDEQQFQSGGNLQAIYLPPKTVGLPYILLGDAGQNGMEIGCGDSMVLQNVPVPATLSSQETLIKRMYTQIFNHANLGQGQESFLPQQGLAVQDVVMSGKTIDLYFTGQLQLAGVCDNPRVVAQLVSVPAQLGFDDVQVFINDETLESYLGLKE